MTIAKGHLILAADVEQAITDTYPEWLPFCFPNGGSTLKGFAMNLGNSSLAVGLALVSIGGLTPRTLTETFGTPFGAQVFTAAGGATPDFFVFPQGVMYAPDYWKMYTSATYSTGFADAEADAAAQRDADLALQNVIDLSEMQTNFRWVDPNWPGDGGIGPDYFVTQIRLAGRRRI
jgi:hypothetical protein